MGGVTANTVGGETVVVPPSGGRAVAEPVDADITQMALLSRCTPWG